MERKSSLKKSPITSAQARDNKNGSNPTKSGGKGVTLDTTGKKHDGGGIRTSVHGYIYQADLLLLFMSRALELRYDFSIATEVQDAAAFDDIVFQYQNSGTTTYRFLQAKHKQNDDQVIIEQDLTSNGPKDDFSVPRYYIAYCKIRNAKRQLFENKSEYKDFTICTNINIDPSLEEHFYEIEEKDDFLQFDKLKYALNSRRLLLDNKSGLYQKLANILRNINIDNPDHNIIAKRLGIQVGNNFIQKKKRDVIYNITIEEIFKENRDWIFKTIFDLGTMKKEQKRVMQLKRSFLYPESDNKTIMALSEAFLAAYFEHVNQHRPDSAQETEDEKNRTKQKLACMWFELGKSFVDKPEGKDKKVSLPDHEVDNFLGKLVFAVSQPNNDELKSIFYEETQRLNLGDGGMVSGHLQACILQWIQKREGNFATAVDFKNLMTDIERQFIAIRLNALALEHRTNVTRFGCTFKNKDTLLGINKFLKSKDNTLLLYYDCKLLNDIKLMQLFKANMKETHNTEDENKINKDINITTEQNVRSNRVNQDDASDKPSQATDGKPFEDTENGQFMILYSKTTHYGTNMCPLEAFRSKANTLLIIEITDSSEFNTAKDLILKISKNRTGSRMKKLIVTLPLTLRDIFISRIMFDATLRMVTSTEIEDKENIFEDLTEESQKKLLEVGKLNIRGCEVSISNLDSPELRQWLKGDVLSQLVRRELTLHIRENNDPDYNEVKNYYLCRFMYRRILITKQICSDVKFSRWKGDVPNLNQEIILVSESKDEYTNLCNSTKNIVHWLKTVNTKDVWQWQESRGSLNNIRKYEYKNWRQNSPEDKSLNRQLGSNDNFSVGEDMVDIVDVHSVPTCASDLQDRVVIISAEPGMGKSTVLSHIVEQNVLRSDDGAVSYTVKVNLRDYSEDLHFTTEGSVSIVEAIKFLYKFINMGSVTKHSLQKLDEMTLNEDGSLTLTTSDDNTLDWIQLKLFTYLYNERKIVVLFDGFDEIARRYKEKVLNLLKTLKHSRLHKLWVTTRPYNIHEELENKLETFSYQLVPLNTAQQKEFFIRFSGRSSGDDIKNISREVKKIRTLAGDQSVFMGIPLHLWMIATIYKNSTCSGYTLEEQKNLTLFDLYTRFFDKKFQLFSKSNKYDQKFEELYELSRRKLQKMGIMELYAQDEVPQELISAEDWQQLVQAVRSLREETGLVTRLDGDHPRFLHRTFAEYFAADFLADKLTMSRDRRRYVAAKDFLYRTLTSNKCSPGIMTFLNYKIVSFSEHVDIFNAAIALDRHKLAPLENHTSCFDALGRNIMHLMFSSGKGCWNKSKILYYMSLIKNTESFAMPYLFLEDNLFRWTPIHYIIACHDCSTTTPIHRFISEVPDVMFPHSYEKRGDNTARACHDCRARSLLEIGVDRFDYDTDDDTDSDTDFNVETILDDSLIDSSVSIDDFDDCIPTDSNNSQRYCDKKRVTMKDEKGLTPLMLAAKRGCTLYCFKVLLSMLPLDVDVQDKDGKTALHYALYRAEHRHQMMLVYILLKKMQADVLISDHNGITPLDIIFCNKNNFEVGVGLVHNIANQKNPQYRQKFIQKISENRDWGCYLLSENWDLTSVMLKCFDIDVNWRDNEGRTPLHYVFQNKLPFDDLLLLRLIENNANVKARDNCGRLASYYNINDMIKILIEGAVPPKLIQLECLAKTHSQAMTPFILSMEFNNDIAVHVLSRLENIRNILLVYNTFSLNIRDSHGRTALHYAVMFKKHEHVAFLINHGANVNAQDDYYKTPLAYLKRRKYDLNNLSMTKAYMEWVLFFDAKILHYLLSNGAYCDDVPDEFHDNYLIISIKKLFNAVKSNDIHEIQRVRDSTHKDIQTIVNARSKLDGRPIHCAVINDRPDIVKLLLSYGAYANSLGVDDKIPAYLTKNEEIYTCILLVAKLISAASRGDIDEVSECINRGVIVNGGFIDEDMEGHYALHVLAQSSNPRLEIVHLLLRHDANVHFRTRDDSTIFHLARQHTKLMEAHINFLQALVQHIYNKIANELNQLFTHDIFNFLSPLYCAILRENEDIISEMMFNTELFNLIAHDNIDTYTPLGCAALSDNREVARIFLEEQRYNIFWEFYEHVRTRNSNKYFFDRPNR